MKSLTKDAGERRRTADGFDPVTMMRRRGTVARAPAGRATAARRAAPQRAVRNESPPRAFHYQQPRRGPVPEPYMRSTISPDSPELPPGSPPESTSRHGPDSSAESLGAYEGPSDTWMNDRAAEKRHEELIETILQEEEAMIAAHRSHVDEVMALVKEEMSELNEVDQPGSSIDAYITKLDGILEKKEEKIGALRNRLHCFQAHLREEHELTQRFAARDQAAGV